MSARTAFKFSYSEKRDIVTCPHRYELITIQGVQTIDADVVRRLLVPNVIDQALTAWVNNCFAGSLEEIAVDKFRVYVRNNDRSIRWKHPMDCRDQELKLCASAKRLDASMREHGLCRSDVRAQPMMKAVVKLTNGQEIKLTGKLDLLYTDEPSIWDLKMTENPKWLDRKQLIYYDFGMSLQLERKVKRCGFLVPAMNPPVQEIPPVGRAEWEELFEELNFGIQTIVSGQFPDLGNEQEDCYLCFAKRFCRRYAGGPTSVVAGTKSSRVGL